eukprot:scaffold45694_cov70-Phaeocystis_antarctica.AAC.4
MVGSDPLVAYTSRWFRDGGAEIGWLGCAESSSDIRPERLGLRPGPSRGGDRRSDPPVVGLTQPSRWASCGWTLQGRTLRCAPIWECAASCGP